MTGIFISHSSRDAAAAENMRAWLMRQGHTSLFLDFDPEQGIPAGSNWQQTLHQKLAGCQAVVALLTPNWLASTWCFAEVVLAQDRGKAIFPVKVAPCDLNGLFAHLQQIDLAVDPDDGYRRLAAGLKARGLDPLDVFAWDPTSGPPYPGLMAFERKDAAVFFGRAEEIAKARESLDRLRQLGREAPRIVLFLGASGSGKSSLVRAGLLPRLEKEPVAWLTVPPFRPRQDPLGELAEALAEAFERHERPHARDELRTLLAAAAAKDPPDGGVLLDLARELAVAAGQREATVLLTVDQAEEAFGPRIADERVRDRSGTAATGPNDLFLRLLRAAAEQADHELIVVATMRSDFLGAFQTNAALHEPSNSREFAYEVVTVDPMPVDRIAEVIEGPARVADLRLGDGLVERMVRDTGTGRALPLLAFTLWRLYDEHGRRGVLEIEQYERLRGIQGAVGAEADQIVKGATKEDLEALRAALVPGMVRSNPEGGHLRRRALWRELPPRALPLLTRFVSRRLLVKDLDQEGQETVEVAHEALFSAWPRLATWLDEDRDKLHLFDGLHRAAQEWNESRERWLIEDLPKPRPVDDLAEGHLVHQGARLRQVLELTATAPFALAKGSVVQAYLDACARREHRQQRRKRLVLGTIAGLFMGIALAAALGMQQWLQAQAQASNAQIQMAAKLAAESSAATDRGDSVEGARRALQAVAALPEPQWPLSRMPWFAARLTDGAEASQVRGALVKAVFHIHDADPLAAAEAGGNVVYAARFAPPGEDGRQRLVTATSDGAWIWDLTSNAGPIALQGHDSDVYWAEFSPDGRRVVTASDDRTARVWDAASGAELVALRGHEGWLNTASFAADGKRIVTASADGTARIWDAVSGAGKELLVLTGHEDDVLQARFSPDGKRVVTAAKNREAWVWDALVGEKLVALEGHTGWVRAAEFSPDGQRLVTGGADGEVRLWDAGSGQLIRRGYTGPVRAAAFDPSGRLTVTASEDGTARIWDVDDLDGTWESHTMRFWQNRDFELAVLPHRDDQGEPATVWSAAFSPDGQRIVTVTEDGAVRLWWCRTFESYDRLETFARKRTAASSGDGGQALRAYKRRLASVE